MNIKHLKDCPEFTAGDDSKLREILNPLSQKITINYSLAHAVVNPGEATIPHFLESVEVYYIIRGTGIVSIDNEKCSVTIDDTIYIPPRVVQYIENTGPDDLEFLCIVDPAWTPGKEHIVHNT